MQRRFTGSQPTNKRAALIFTLVQWEISVCSIEEGDTTKHGRGSLKPGHLLICLKRCFSVYLGACQGSSSTTGQHFFEEAACALASINFMVYLSEEMKS